MGTLLGAKYLLEFTRDFDHHYAKVAVGQGQPPHQLFQQAIGGVQTQGGPVQAHEHAEEDGEADDDLGAFGADDEWTEVRSRKERWKQKQQHNKTDQTRGVPPVAIDDRVGLAGGAGGEQTVA